MIDKKKLMTEINNFYYDDVFDKKYSIAQIFASIMSIISSQPEEGEWISCSEDYPDEPDEKYIVTAVIENEKFVDLATYDGIKYWDEYKTHEIIAWMPLPDPYSEEDKK